MKHARVSRTWRSVESRARQQSPQGVLSAFAFNVCMLLLPLAGAAALLVIARDHLYAYEYSEAGARAMSARIERLNGELIQLDFDRVRQWDDLVALELTTGDVEAARGFLLSGGGMLPRRSAALINRAANDGEREVIALELLSPGTRARYEALAPLPGGPPRPATTVTLGDAQDFELMARALLAEPETDALQFVLTGFSLGLAGDADQRLINGAASLLLASRRPDYPVGLAAEVEAMLAEAAPIARFREIALSTAEGEAAGGYANAAPAFRSAIDPQAAARTRAALNEIGAMGEATSVTAAADMLLHASGLRDLPRLRVLAQAAGDRVAAAAKRLPRDGRLLEAARGELTITRDLAIALAFVALALAGLVALALFNVYQTVRGMLRRQEEDEWGGELVDIGERNWRPL